ncbi:MAG: hypothetical protein ACHQSE_03070 [Gemmatimonadales bacterium]
MSHSSHRSIRLALLALASAACARDTPTAPATRLAFGEWGGDRAQVVASDSVTEVTYGCTAGEFAGSITLDANGRFSVNGTFNPYLFPVARAASMPAQLSGQVLGNTLTFAVAVNDTIAKQVLSLGPSVVVLGRPADIVVCPV